MKLTSKLGPLRWPPHRDNKGQELATSQFPPSPAVRPLFGVKEPRNELPYRYYGSSAPRLRKHGFDNRLSDISSRTLRNQESDGEPITSDRRVSSPGTLYFPTIKDFWSIYEHITNIAYEEIVEEHQPVTISLNPATSHLTSSVSHEAHRIALHYKFDLVYIFRLSPEMLQATGDDTIVTEVHVIYPSIPVATLNFPYHMYERILKDGGWTVHGTDCLPPIYSRGYSRSFDSSGPARASAPSLIFTCLQGLAGKPRTVDLTCLYYDAETLVDIAKDYIK